MLACLTGAAVLHLGHTKVPAILPAVQQAQEIVFAIVGFVMKLAPLAVFGATAHLVGQYGVGVMSTYGKLILVCYATALIFLLLLAVALKAVAGVSLWKFVRYTREEMLLALGTASSETVMPRMMQKLRHAGCRDDAVGLVLPTGYSFNLDGASIYLSVGTLFIAQAVGVDLSLGQQITVVLILMLTSKGMAGVPGSAFLALSATASALGVIPVGAVALLLGVDRIMDSMRVATNLLGNCVAVSRWEGALDSTRAKKVSTANSPSWRSRRRRTRPRSLPSPKVRTRSPPSPPLSPSSPPPKEVDRPGQEGWRPTDFTRRPPPLNCRSSQASCRPRHPWFSGSATSTTCRPCGNEPSELSFPVSRLTRNDLPPVTAYPVFVPFRAEL
ncbi:hypothetical protein QF035_006990 [Streptomyces umbrinus]|uniref:Uncharacterized protein n=1 Tax=Streptomyces umbrinus TaxID=67370 RepID=A0ABU0T131_9ACTN|nr:hypothetical protein [Streptomyces umbrinus]